MGAIKTICQKRMHKYLQRNEKANNILRCLQKYSEEPMNIRLHEYSKVSKIWNRIKKIPEQTTIGLRENKCKKEITI